MPTFDPNKDIYGGTPPQHVTEANQHFMQGSLEATLPTAYIDQGDAFEDDEDIFTRIPVFVDSKVAPIVDTNSSDENIFSDDEIRWDVDGKFSGEYGINTQENIVPYDQETTATSTVVPATVSSELSPHLQPAKPSLITTITTRARERRAITLEQRATAAQQQQERNQLQQANYEHLLTQRQAETDILFNDVANALEHAKKYPTLVSPRQNFEPLFFDRELQRLTLPKIINDTIAHELSIRLLDSADNASLSSDQQTVELLHNTARQLNTGRKNIFDNTDPQTRKAYDTKVIDTVHDVFDAQQIAATEKFIHNPYPSDGTPHRVYAFSELCKLIGFNNFETTIDNDGQQPAVITRLVAHDDGRIEIDPNIDGVGKMYAALNNFTFYERRNGVPDPRNVSGIVDQQLLLENDTPGYFVAHMQQGSIAPDVDNDNDKELAFFVKYPVNPVLVTSDMQTKIMLKTLDTAISESQFAKPVSHPIDLAISAVIGQVSFALPRERALVKAAMEADARAQATRDAEHKKQLAAMQSPTLLALSGVHIDSDKNS